MPGPIIGYLEFPDGTCRPIYDDGRCQRLIDEHSGDKAWRLYMILGEEDCDPAWIMPAEG